VTDAPSSLSGNALDPALIGGVPTAADFARLTQHRAIVLLTDGFSTPFLAKTAINLLKYRNDDIAAVLETAQPAKTTEELLGVGGQVPVIDRLSAVAKADALYVGIAPPGGKLPPAWRPIILEAIRRRLDIVSGLHEFLAEDAEYLRTAQEHGARLIDVRRNRHKTTGTGRAFRSGNCRVHAIGQDCSIGKMVASLEVQLGLQAAGQDAVFLATGQTGIMISGTGVPIDCVVSDFVSGAAEEMVAEHENHDFVLIEGQGSLTHPAFSAVTLGLLHGCAPDGLIYCYEAGRKIVKGFDPIPIPDLGKQLDFCLTAANFRHPCRLIGVAINSRALTPDQAAAEIERAERRFGVPACDVYRNGPDKLVRATIELRRSLVRE
jgi:uncharacterized NAD-dependent epimerase/dehydratase family protein